MKVLTLPFPPGGTQSIHLEERRIRLQTGDRLVLFSDGVVDVAVENGDVYGRERLQNAVHLNRDHAPEDLLNGIVQDMQTWSHNQLDGQDFALLVVAAL